MKINKSAFNKKKVQLDDLSAGDIFLFKDHVFIKEESLLFPMARNLENGQLETLVTGYIEVNQLKVKIFLDE